MSRDQLLRQSARIVQILYGVESVTITLPAAWGAKMRFQFSIRDLFWLILVVALVSGWWLDHHAQLNHFEFQRNSLELRNIELEEKLGLREPLPPQRPTGLSPYNPPLKTKKQ